MGYGRGRVVVHTEGDTGDVLFQVEAIARDMREGDTFNWMTPDGTTHYKIESVDIRFTSILPGLTNPPTPSPSYKWTTPEIWYGVTVIP